MQWLALGLTLTGYILVIKKRRSGFIVWMMSNILWVWIQGTAGIWAMVVGQSIFCITNFIGYIKWKEIDCGKKN